MPDIDGLSLLKIIKEQYPTLPLLLWRHIPIDAAVNAYQQGAFDYLPKPFDIDETLALIDRALLIIASKKQLNNDETSLQSVSDMISWSTCNARGLPYYWSAFSLFN